MAKGFFRFALMIVLLSASAPAQWVQTSGPEGGDVRSLARLDSILFGGTNTGVVLSADSGAHWDSTGLKNYVVTSLAAITGGPSNPYIFAGTVEGGVFRSSDYGANWTQVVFGLTPSHITALVVSNNVLVAGTDTGGVFISPSNGDYWITANNGLANIGIRSLAIVHSRIYVGTNDGLYYSTDTAASWINTGLNGEAVTSLAHIDTSLIAGTDTNGVWLSTDGGTVWTNISSPSMGSSIIALVVLDGSVYAATSQGVFRTPNHGQYWVPCNAGLPNSGLLTLDVDGANLNAGTFSGLYRSTDGGVTWMPRYTGMKASVVYSLVGYRSRIFAGARAGLFGSTNAGDNWTSTGITQSITSVAASSTQIVAGTWGYVYTSRDSGASWERFPLPGSTGRVLSLASIGDEFLVGTEIAGVLRFKQTVPGSDSIATTSLTGTKVNSLSVSDTNVFAGTPGGVFRSTNSGKDWTAVNTGLTDLNVTAVAVRDSTVFAGTFGGAIFHSTDNGNNWVALSSAPHTWQIVCLMVIGNNVFAGTWQGGLFLSTDNGTTWSTANTGLTTSWAENSSVVDALAVVGSDMYVATHGAAVYRRPLSEMITVIVPAAPPQQVLPQNQAVLASNQFDFSWKAVAGAKFYQLEASKDSLFKTAIFLNDSTLTDTVRNSHSTDSTVTRPPDTTYYWRVRVQNAAGWSAWSSTWTYRYLPAAAAPPHLIFPQTQAVLPSEQFSFKWSVVAGVMFYHLEASKDSLFKTGVFISDSTLTDTVRSSQPTDSTVTRPPEATYYWRVRVRNAGGWSAWSSSSTYRLSTEAVGPSSSIPTEFSLSQNYPNPFNPTTTIEYGLPRRSRVTLTVFNLLGQAVARLVNGEMEAGYHAVRFDGFHLASGVYVYRLTAGSFVESKKFLLMK